MPPCFRHASVAEHLDGTRLASGCHTTMLLSAKARGMGAPGSLCAWQRSGAMGIHCRTSRHAGRALDGSTRAFYRDALHVLGESGVPFLVGGAYALQCYTGIQRHTKDFDVFVRPADCQLALR